MAYCFGEAGFTTLLVVQYAMRVKIFADGAKLENMLAASKAAPSAV
jgi:hypothetical protein